MKGDFTRHTFDPAKHYASVRMQQGRVQLDADWNEQADIVLHRAETDTRDTLGACGAPMHEAAFGILLDTAGLDADALAYLAEVLPGGLQPGDFLLSPGRYYVDGILCENEHYVPYTAQPSLPGVAPLDVSARGTYILYLDVWRRHITALEAPPLRESALGGPDTTTRLQTVWQVRALPVGSGPVGCLDPVAAYEAATAPSTGTLRARAEAESTVDTPCLVPPSAGYRGLENQLYRVEIHHAGTAVDVTSTSGNTAITELPAADQVRAASGTWNVGDVVEVYLSATGADPMQGHLAVVTAKSGRLLTLNRPLPGISLADEPRLRRVSATYKWSRDNGIVVTGVTAVNGREITVDDLGLDEVLGFEPGQWVELIDHERELNGQPGELAQIEAVLPATRIVRLHAAPTWPGDLAAVDPARGLRLRRWDGAGAVKIDPSAGADPWIALEDGVEVEFDGGEYHTGDYWLIPARTATADARSGRVEWPVDGAGAPVRRPALGIRHHYCRIGVLEVADDGTVTVQDCRRLFPPATEHLRLVYIGGDGQESLPGQPLRKPLEVGVFNGSHPVDDVAIEFTTVPGGRLAADEAGVATGANTLVVVTQDGIARCYWQLKNDGAMPTQQVRARIVDAGGTPAPEAQYIRFTANLSLADQVAYDPGDCAGLAGRDTVQKAIDGLAAAASLYILDGNGQEVRPGQPLPKKPTVLVASACGPVTDPAVRVRFEVTGGAGTLDGGAGPVEVPVGTDGTASCEWQLDASTQNQEVTATLVAGSVPTAEPTTVRFTATLSAARHVGFDPEACSEMAAAGINDVQRALEFLCARETHGDACCTITVGKGGRYPTLRDAFDALREQPDVSLCLLPGDHVVDDGLMIPIEPSGDAIRRVSITGTGPGCRVYLGDDLLGFTGLESLRLADFDLYAEGPKAAVRIRDCADVLIRGCRFRQEESSVPLLTVVGEVARARIVDSMLITTLEEEGAAGRALVLAGTFAAQVERCDVVGTVHLYGEGAEIPAEVLGVIIDNVRNGGCTPIGAGTDVRFSGGSFTRFTVDEDLVRRFEETDGTQLPGLYRRFILAESSVMRDGNVFIAENIALTTNHFDALGLVGTGAAASAIVLGNGPSPESVIQIGVPEGAGRAGETNLIEVGF